jgi:hypothetical protein
MWRFFEYMNAIVQNWHNVFVRPISNLHYTIKIDRRRCCINWSSKSAFHQFGQEPAIVDVGTAENDGADFLGRKRKRAIIQLLLRLRALEKAAVNQHLAAIGLETKA